VRITHAVPSSGVDDALAITFHTPGRPCRTAHGQRVRRGRATDQLGRDGRGTELDPGVSFAE